MSKVINRISELFGLKDVSDYPELYYRRQTNLTTDLDRATGVLFTDSGSLPRNLRIRNL
jgi:hypothetical protein